MAASKAQTIMQINRSWAVFSFIISLAAVSTGLGTASVGAREASVTTSLAVMAAPAIAKTPVARHKSCKQKLGKNWTWTGRE